MMPYSLQQATARFPKLVINVLSESKDVTPLAWDLAVPIHVPMNRILFDFMMHDSANLSQSSASEWIVTTWTRGTTRFDMVQSSLNVPSTATGDGSGSNGVVFVPQITRTVQLPPRAGAILWATVALPHSGTYQVKWVVKWSFQTQPIQVLTDLFTMGLQQRPDIAMPLLFQPVR